MLTDDATVQFQQLADKYAPATPDITDTLAKLQLPPHTSVDPDSPVPLPKRENPLSQHHVAVVIRDGRRLASQVASMTSKTSDSTRDSGSRTSTDKQSSMSTALEQDFTIEGKKGNLQCPFSRRQSPSRSGDEPDDDQNAPDPVPHDIDDPICAAMYEESTSPSHAAKSNTASKCPIRYMDKHSPEEIAHYVETHKHELPRSHEICLRRYQHNEEQVKKLDSKYGNIVSMVEGLGQLHQSMLRESEDGQEPTRFVEPGDVSNERVHKWANTVTATATSDPEEASEHRVPSEPDETDDPERLGHFDRPLKEVRVGESPSRPWGISVPIYETADHEDQHPFSPPPAPVRMPGHLPEDAATAHDDSPPARKPGKCPFDHTKMQGFPGMAGMASVMAKHHGPTAEDDDGLDGPVTPQPPHRFSPTKETPSHSHPPPPMTSSSHHLGQPPTFINPGSGINGGPPPNNQASPAPQMVFTGPVFIGYPVEQAIQIMNQYRPPHP